MSEITCPACGEASAPMPHCDRVGCNFGTCCACMAALSWWHGVVTATPLADYRANVQELLSRTGGVR